MNPFDPRLTLIAAQARVRTPHVFHCFQAMRVQGKQFHAAAFAQFAGLEERHVLAIISALTDNDCLPSGRAPVERRASRLPEGWAPPDDYIAYAVDKRMWSPQESAEEADVFYNYWIAQPGQRALKTDWLATWRNWVQRSQRPDGTYRASTETVSHRENMLQTIALYERIGRTTEAAEIRAQLESNVVPLKRA